MKYLRRILALIVGTSMLFALPAAKTLAYGAADHPLAQLEFSGNCDNPSFPMWAFPPAGVGVGGIWLWIEVDADQTGDYAGANCDHTVGGTGTAGAQPLNGAATWVYSTGIPAGAAAPFRDPNNRYYVVALSPYPLRFAFPVTQGHYSRHPVPGVSQELTVAP